MTEACPGFFHQGQVSFSEGAEIILSGLRALKKNLPLLKFFSPWGITDKKGSEYHNKRETSFGVCAPYSPHEKYFHQGQRTYHFEFH